MSPEILTGNYQRAADLYRESLQLEPNWAEAMRNLAFAEEKLDNQASMCALWEKVGTSEKYADEARGRLKDLCEEVPAA